MSVIANIVSFTAADLAASFTSAVSKADITKLEGIEAQLNGDADLATISTSWGTVAGGIVKGNVSVQEFAMGLGNALNKVLAMSNDPEGISKSAKDALTRYYMAKALDATLGEAAKDEDFFKAKSQTISNSKEAVLAGLSGSTHKDVKLFRKACMDAYNKEKAADTEGDFDWSVKVFSGNVLKDIVKNLAESPDKPLAEVGSEAWGTKVDGFVASTRTAIATPDAPEAPAPEDDTDTGTDDEVGSAGRANGNGTEPTDTDDEEVSRVDSLVEQLRGWEPLELIDLYTKLANVITENEEKAVAAQKAQMA